MYNPSRRAEVYEFAKQLMQGLWELDRAPFPAINYDLVLDIVETKDKEAIWHYYYVDNITRTLFWLKPYNMKSILNTILGVKEPGHISE